MRVRQWRRANLQTLVKRAGGQAKLFQDADVDLNPSFLSQVLNGHRSLGEKAARRMESRLGLPAGTLDVNPEDESRGSDLPPPMRPTVRRLAYLASKLVDQQVEELIAMAETKVMITKQLFENFARQLGLPPQAVDDEKVARAFKTPGKMAKRKPRKAKDGAAPKQ